MAILNYTTKIDAYKTLMEIQQILAKRGAMKIIIDNNANRQPTNLSFSIIWNNAPVAFSLPCNHEGVLRAMKKAKNVPRNLCTEEQALRVGWRIVKDWVEAQMAIVEAEMASLAEVFLPYAVTKQGGTLYQQLNDNNTMLLTN